MALPTQSFAAPVQDWRWGGCVVQVESPLHAASGLSHWVFTHLPQSLAPKPGAGGGVAAAGAAEEAAGAAAEEESPGAADAEAAGDDESLGAAEPSDDALLAVVSAPDGESAGLLAPPQATSSMARRNVVLMGPRSNTLDTVRHRSRLLCDSLAEMGRATQVPGLAVEVALAPLAREARIADLPPAVDVRFLAVLTVIAALAGDAFVRQRVARVEGAVGVLLAGVPEAADRAVELVLARDAARHVRPAREPLVPDGAARIADDARPDALARAMNDAAVVVRADLRSTLLVPASALVARRNRHAPLARVSGVRVDRAFVGGIARVAGVARGGLGVRIRFLGGVPGWRILEGRIGRRPLIRADARIGQAGFGMLGLRVEGGVQRGRISRRLRRAVEGGAPAGR